MDVPRRCYGLVGCLNAGVDVHAIGCCLTSSYACRFASMQTVPTGCWGMAAMARESLLLM